MYEEPPQKISYGNSKVLAWSWGVKTPQDPIRTLNFRPNPGEPNLWISKRYLLGWFLIQFCLELEGWQSFFGQLTHSTLHPSQLQTPSNYLYEGLSLLPNLLLLFACIIKKLFMSILITWQEFMSCSNPVAKKVIFSILMWWTQRWTLFLNYLK